MSGSFSTSSQSSRWLVKHSDPRFQAPPQMTQSEWFMTKAYFIDCTQRLAKSLGLKQRVVATACMYLHRHFLCSKFPQNPNPCLLLSTCVYVASKVEECALQASAVQREGRRLFGAQFNFTDRDILDLELQLLVVLNFDLIVHHPYRCLSEYCEDAGTSPEHIQTAWAIVNDSFKSDVCLIHPPHETALAAMFMAAQTLDIELTSWLQSLDYDMTTVSKVVEGLLDMYEALASLHAKYGDENSGNSLAFLQPVVTACTERIHTTNSGSNNSNITKTNPNSINSNNASATIISTDPPASVDLTTEKCAEP
eukprot:c6500_g1_i2.p1 GENE.c6500_g1_i2~~c6500_g1_i2.p1  ORF type:complete len:309 (+),score=69.31 c6500_g1_i2:18-944(+)